MQVGPESPKGVPQASPLAHAAATLVVLGVSLIPLPVRAQILRDNLWVANGSVRAVVTSGGILYLGGQFTRIAPATGAAVALDAGTGAPQQPYPTVVGPSGGNPLAENKQCAQSC